MYKRKGVKMVTGGCFLENERRQEKQILDTHLRGFVITKGLQSSLSVM